MSDKVDPLSVGVPPERIKCAVPDCEIAERHIHQPAQVIVIRKAKCRPISDDMDERDLIDWQARAESAERQLAEATAKLEKAWQPIETAPKDGRTVIVWPLRVFASWDARFNEWISGEDGCALTPTHWHPAPPPAPGEALASVSPPPASLDLDKAEAEAERLGVQVHPSNGPLGINGTASVSPPPSKHKWKTQRAGGDPTEAGSYERVTFCDECGTERTEDNESELCVSPPPPDEEMVPHRFNSRSPYETGDDRDIWCKDCEYHRDHKIHRVSPPPVQETREPEHEELEALEKELADAKGSDDGCAFCSWCDFSLTYKVGTHEQNAAGLMLLSHAMGCEANPVVQRALAAERQVAEAEARLAKVETLRQKWIARPEEKLSAVLHCANELGEALEKGREPKIGGDGPPVASCLLCGQRRTLAVWYAGTRAGVCEKCRSAERQVAEATAKLEKVAELPEKWRDGAWETVSPQAYEICADELGEALASVSPPPSQDEHALYMELLLAVVRKHPSESRHQTALRYIRDAERRVGGPASSPPPSQETREPEQEEKDDTRAGEPVTRPPARATAPTD